MKFGDSVKCFSLHPEIKETNYPNQKRFKVVCQWQTINSFCRNRKWFGNYKSAKRLFFYYCLFGQFFTCKHTKYKRCTRNEFKPILSLSFFFCMNLDYECMFSTRRIFRSDLSELFSGVAQQIAMRVFTSTVRSKLK